MAPSVPEPWTRIGSSLCAKAGAAANRLAIRVERSVLPMAISRPYRVKNWPRAPGAFEPWIALWQFRQARATRRLLTAGLGCPVLPTQAGFGSPGAQTKPPAAPYTVPGCRDPSWQSWQRFGACSFSSLPWTEPCGLWQVTQFSSTGGWLNTYGPRLSAWHE